MATASTRRVNLTPKAGFVIKTTNEILGTYTAPARSAGPSETSSAPVSVTVPKGFKIFLNICWDGGVPPPPERSEEEIRRAMMGEDLNIKVSDGKEPYFVPVVVSDGRSIKDKAGNPSLVFDCVFNTSLKPRTTKDHDFRAFLIEIALERVEDKSGLSLSREIGTPNIASKGTLEPRTVLIPMLDGSGKPAKPVIEEIGNMISPDFSSKKARKTPEWNYSSEMILGKPGVKIIIRLPNLTKADLSAATTTVDVEPHRIMFRGGGIYELDLRLGVDGKLTSEIGHYDDDIPPSLSRVGPRLHADDAVAEWRVDEGCLVIRTSWQ